jgi:homoserine kinase
MIKAIGTLSNFSRRAAFLNVSHCCGLIAAILSNKLRHLKNSRMSHGEHRLQRDKLRRAMTLFELSRFDCAQRDFL